jgi:hypothetical protein
MNANFDLSNSRLFASIRGSLSSEIVGRPFRLPGIRCQAVRLPYKCFHMTERGDPAIAGQVAGVVATAPAAGS